jgi:23S rRNA (pseudouridine1915-N3)-methyltransferase
LRVHVVAVGRLKAGPERDLAARYGERFAAVGRSLGLSGLVVREIAESQARSVPERKAQEAAGILAALPEGCVTVRLDERGEAISSDDFAHLIRTERDRGRGHLAFVIGGADGIGEAVSAQVPRAISFGRMTMPHQFARVLLLEQLYRAATLLAGHPYHRA